MGPRLKVLTAETVIRGIEQGDCTEGQRRMRSTFSCWRLFFSLLLSAGGMDKLQPAGYEEDLEARVLYLAYSVFLISKEDSNWRKIKLQRDQESSFS